MEVYRLVRSAITIVTILSALMLCSRLRAAETPPSPDTIEGLEAWYRVEFSEKSLGEKGSVDLWRDASGNGHDLKRDGDNRAGTLKNDAVNGLPAVDIDVGRYLVESPFELTDHTIFLVALVKYGDQALFRGEDSWSRGVVLYQDGRRHVIRAGGVGTSSPSYTEILGRRAEFGLTVLGRENKVLRAWIDGADLSSWTRTDEPLEVAALFHVEMSQFVDRNAKGAEIAELLFYDRFLDDEERDAVSAYLAAKYGLRLRESVALTLAERMQRLAEDQKTRLAWLLPKDEGSLNDSVGHRLVWSGDVRKRGPFTHEEGEKGSRIYCTEDGTSVYLYLALPLMPEGSGARLRALVLKNGSEYLEDDAETAVLGGADPGEFETLELDTELTLDSGDYIEIIVFQDGDAGTVKIGPDPTGLMLELR